MLRRIFSLLFLFLIVHHTNAQCPLDINENTIAPSDNLLLYLPFNGNLNNLGNGTFTSTLNGATFIPTPFGQGLSFDGLDDYLQIDPSIDLSTDFTICAWVSPTVQQEWMGIFSVREQCSSSFRGYSVGEVGLGNYNVPSLSFQVNQHMNCTGFSIGDRYINDSLTVPNGVPTFITIRVKNNSSENREVKFYVNCFEYNSSIILNTNSSASFNSSINYLTTIGATSSINGFTNTFDGTLDEIRLYDIALPDSAIKKIYRSYVPLSVSSQSMDSCSISNADIMLQNTETNVEYQLRDIGTNQLISSPTLGNCSTLTLSTGNINQTSQFQIVARDISSGCTINLDTTIQVFTNTFTSSFSIGNDTTLCEGESITLNAALPNANYLWQDGSTGSTLFVNEAGLYSVQASNECETKSDTIQVRLESCNCMLSIPNVFSPNNDGINDSFIPEFDCNFSVYKLTILNRWGETVFDTDLPNGVWDGTLNGKKVPAGNYAYVLDYKTISGANKTLTGNIVLIK